MRRHAVRVAAAVALAMTLLAACSSGSSKPSTTVSTTPTTPSSSTGSTTEPVTAPPSSTTLAPTTTTAACASSGGATVPVITGPPKGSQLLLTVSATAVACVDRVVFSFATKSGAVPSCRVSYQPGPFTKDGSGAPVTVAGTAFVVVRCEPAYGYDFENGRTTYTGPKAITPVGTRYVRELVETGDFEGVLTWVIGLAGQQPYTAVAKTLPPGLSTVVLTFG